MKSMHLIASAKMGGAERWFVRFLQAMQAAGEEVHAVVRRDSELASTHLRGIPHSEVGFRTVWDPLSRWEVSQLLRRDDAPIVQTYMSRATRLTHLPPGRGRVHIARLGGYYRLPPFTHAHAWVGNTRALCDWMIQGGLPAERVHHITNFAEPAKPADAKQLQQLRAQLDVQPDDWLILTAGRMVGFKGHRYLIEAMKHLPPTVAGRRTRLVLIGDGDLMPELTRQVTELGLQDRVHFAGWQHDPSAWFHLADMVMFPSRDEETLGNVILEAWAYGKPLVTTAFRGARELTRHQQDAWVVPCDEPLAIAEGMATVMNDPALMTAMVAQGHRRLAQEFSPQAIIGAYQALYRKLLGEV
ncbi:glycosyltransferase [Aquabacterium fontiphilum]|uniref:glycosyltransferase n=1 Tax=Aquabacterium fontiphilum TaxID=450365 RepID=UPI001378F3FD|nr:glycosyltransferase [Aquabacterium fontiphilum]NBD19579.1 glycosyltransferase [Aquabacterium fontiphilum]